MKKYSLFIFVLCSLGIHAQTQSGVVRTVSRPDAPSQRLQGVVVRVQGDYNPVMTDEQGAFQVLMPGYKNGSAYTLAGINKGGYELREPEIVGRQLPFSSSVPLEIIMVSRRQLQRDKQRIEQAARENIERYYEEQLNALNEELAKATLSNEEYEKRLNALEGEYDRFEPLIEQMAERYARTDYTGLSEEDGLIQQAIEAGDLKLAQERILAKGDPAEREKKMKRIRRLAEAQRDELAADYYHLYAIHLSRLENDSALYYLLRRAELDTTNAQWQLDAGNFYDKMEQRFDEALVLYRRALRYALVNEGPKALRTAQAHNNIAYALARLGQFEEALEEQRVALALYREIYGNDHALAAARLTNVGVIHYYLGRLDSAQAYFDQSEKVYDGLAVGGEDLEVSSVRKLQAQLLNNQAAIDVALEHPDAAYSRLNKALTIVPDDDDQDRLLLYRSMSVVCELSDKKDEAEHYARLADELAKKLGLYPFHSFIPKRWRWQSMSEPSSRLRCIPFPSQYANALQSLQGSSFRIQERSR